MIKYIFCDLDGTLYNEKIKEKDINSIEIAKKSGILFNIATGRVYAHTLSIIDEINIKGYLICENGSYIYNKERECIFKGVLKDFQIKKIIECYNDLEYIDKNNDVIYFKYNGEILMPVDGAKSGYFKNGFTVDPTIMNRETYNSSVGNIGIASMNYEKLTKLVDDFQKKLGTECDVYISSEYTLNIVPKSISKYDAIKQVCKNDNISLDEIATIGDSPNDISMLKNVRMSFAMSNSIDIVKSSATYETPSVADAIKMIMDYNSDIENKVN